MFTRTLQCGVASYGATVLLRPPKVDQAELSYGLVMDPELMVHFLLDWDPKQMKLEDYRGRVAKASGREDAYSWWVYGVDLRPDAKSRAAVGDPEFMGLVGINEIGPDPLIGNKRCGNLFYVLKKEHQKKGVAKVAVTTALNYAFANHELPALEALRVRVVRTNERNMRFACRLGFEEHRVAHDYARDKKLEIWHGYRYP